MTLFFNIEGSDGQYINVLIRLGVYRRRTFISVFKRNYGGKWQEWINGNVPFLIKK